jgi:hypothetical protein
MIAQLIKKADIKIVNDISEKERKKDSELDREVDI